MAKTKKPKDETAPEVVEKHPGGRPSSMTPEICAEIIARLMDGESLTQICRTSEHLPHRATVFRFIATDKEFRDSYAEARAIQADTMADEILDIADDAENDWMLREGKGDAPAWVINGEHVQRSRLRIESRKWLMGKLRPKVYGDKVEVANTHSGPGGGPVQTETTQRVYRYMVHKAEPFSLDGEPE